MVKKLVFCPTFTRETILNTFIGLYRFYMFIFNCNNLKKIEVHEYIENKMFTVQCNKYSLIYALFLL